MKYLEFIETGRNEGIVKIDKNIRMLAKLADGRKSDSNNDKYGPGFQELVKLGFTYYFKHRSNWYELVPTK